GFRLGRVGARSAQDRAAAKLDAVHIVDGQHFDLADIALHEPLEAVVDADDFDAVVDRLDGNRADDAVNARRRTTAHYQCQAAGIRFIRHALASSAATGSLAARLWRAR